MRLEQSLWESLMQAAENWEQKRTEGGFIAAMLRKEAKAEYLRPAQSGMPGSGAPGTLSASRRPGPRAPPVSRPRQIRLGPNHLRFNRTTFGITDKTSVPTDVTAV